MASAFDKLLNKETQSTPSKIQPRTLSGTPLGTETTTTKKGSAFDTLIAEKTKQQPAKKTDRVIPVSEQKPPQVIYARKEDDPAYKATQKKPTFFEQTPLAKIGSNIERLTQRPDEKDLGTSKWSNTLKYLPSTFIETLLPSVRAIRDDPETAAKIKTGDLLAEVPNAVIQTAKEFAKAPIRGAIAPLPQQIKFNIPVLGEVTNASFNTARRIEEGENPYLVAIQEASIGILDTLFFGQIAAKPFQPRIQKPFAEGVKQDPSTIGAGNVEGPKTGRLYTPDVGNTVPAPRAFADAIAKDPNTKLLRAYNPELPTYFRVKTQGGQYIGELFQVKPSFVNTFFKKLKGNPDAVPENQIFLLNKKTVSKADVEEGLSKPIVDGNELDVRTIIPDAPKVAPVVPVEPTISTKTAPDEEFSYKPTEIKETDSNFVKTLKQNEKSEEELSRILVQMEIAEAGKRVFVEQQRAGGTKTVEGVSSTFPKYISEDLRSRELFDKVLGKVKNLDDIELPKNPDGREARLLREVFTELDRSLGTNSLDDFEIDLIKASTPIKLIQDKRIAEYKARAEKAKQDEMARQEDFNIDDVVANFEIPEPKTNPVEKPIYKNASDFIKKKNLDPDSVLVKENDNFVVESTSGNDALLIELPISIFGKPKLTTLNQNKYKSGRRIQSPIEATIKDGEITITDGANRFTQAIANGDKTIPVILENYDGTIPTKNQIKSLDEQVSRSSESTTKQTIPTIESLPEIAKNFKTAEEFINSLPIVYHGTLNKFDTFDIKKAGKNTEWENAKWGFFFIDDAKRAAQFVEDTRPAGNNKSPIIMETFVDIKKPLDLTIEGIVTKKDQASVIYEAMTGEKLDPEDALEMLDDAIDLGTVNEFYEELYANTASKKLFQKAGYDGIISEFGREDGKIIKEIVAFSPEQIKTKAQLEQIWKESNAGEPKVSNAGVYTSKSKANFGKFNDDIDIQMSGIDDIKPIELPELVQLVKELMGKLPQIKVERVRPTMGGSPNGMFKVGPDGKQITLNPAIFKDTAQATKTLAHELGHLIDYLPDETMTRGNLLGRLQSLRKYIANTLTKSGERLDPKLMNRIRREIENDIRKSLNLTWDEYKAQKKNDIELQNRVSNEIYKVIESEHAISNKQIKNELIDLTLAWKPFDPASVPESYVQYRFSPEELYADALSVLFNNPEMLKQIAPKFYDAFFEGLNSKPDVKNAYFDLQDFLKGGEEAVISRRRQNVQQMFKEGDMKAVDLENQRLAKRKMSIKSALLEIKTEFIDKNQKIIDRVRELEKKGTFINEDDDPRYFLEERNYLSGYIKAMIEEYIQPIRISLRDNDLTWNDFGEYLFYKRIASGDRSEQANPQGITPEAAQKSMDALVEQYGGEKMKTVFEDNAKRMREYLLDINEKAYKSGLYSEELFNQMKENPAYVTFQVIEYIEQGMTSAVHKSIGTFKDITNPATASILKSIKVIQATERNNVTKSVVDLYKNYFPEEIKDAEIRTYQMGDKTIKEPKESKLKDEELITYKQDGTPVGFYVDRYTKQAIDNDSIGRNWAFVKFIKTMNDATFRPLFITYNTGFQAFNLIRDFVRVWKNSPESTLLDVAKGYYKALPVAKVRAFGVSNTPKDWELKAVEDLQKMEKNRVVSITFNDLVQGLSDEDSQIERIMDQYGIDYFTNTDDVKKNQQRRLPAPLIKVLDFIKNTGDLIETLPKASGYYEFTKGGTTPISKEDASFIRKNIGSPDFLAGGTVKPISNEVFLFSNAITQALRSDWHIMSSPKTRSSYWRKTFQMNFLPKILMYLAGAGVFGVAMQDMMNDVSEYEKTNYNIIPIGRDTNGKTIYLRLPTDESGRFAGGTFWKAVNMAKNEQTLTQDLFNIFSYTGGQLPGLTPSLAILGDTFQFLSGNNPYDEFRGRQVLSDEVFKAGGAPAAKAYLGWVFQQLGGSVFFSFYHEPSAPKEKGQVESLINLPVIGTVTNRFVRVSDYGTVESLRSIKKRVEQSEARERLDTKEVIYRYVESAIKDPENKNEYKKKMTEELYEGGRPRTATELDKYKEDLKKFDTFFLRGSTTDPNVEALYSATSNNQKVEVLKEIKNNMEDSEYSELKRFLLVNKIVSSEVIIRVEYEK